VLLLLLLLRGLCVCGDGVRARRGGGVSLRVGLGDSWEWKPGVPAHNLLERGSSFEKPALDTSQVDNLLERGFSFEKRHIMGRQRYAHALGLPE
jgi:hypothetical protein